MNAATSPSHIRSRVAWGAVFGGLFVAMTSFMVIGALAAALTLSSVGEVLYESPLWITALSMLSMLLGGFTATYLSAGERPLDAVLHGVVLWGATATMLLFFLMNGISLYGSEMMLGQAEDLFGPVSRADAWWAFMGVAASLAATIGGSLLGLLRETRKRQPARRWRAEPVADAT